MNVYEACPIKRARRTRAELEDFHFSLAETVAEIELAAVRQDFYQAVMLSPVPKGEARGHKLVQRRFFDLREAGEIPYGWTAYNARLVRGHDRYGGSDDNARVAAELVDSPVNVEVRPEDAPAGALVAGLAEEATINSKDRVIMVHKGGLGFATEMAKAAHMPLSTVKNDLARLRKTKLLEDTGQSYPQTNAEEVRPAPGGAVPRRHNAVGDDAVAPLGGNGKVPGAPSRRRLTADEAAKVRRLILRGMSPKLARLQVQAEAPGDPR